MRAANGTCDESVSHARSQEGTKIRKYTLQEMKGELPEPTTFIYNTENSYQVAGAVVRNNAESEEVLRRVGRLRCSRLVQHEYTVMALPVQNCEDQSLQIAEAPSITLSL